MTQDPALEHTAPSALTDQPPYLSVREASKLLCISTWVLYQAIRLGELPVIRWGRRVVLERDDLARFVAAKRDEGVVSPRAHRLLPAEDHHHEGLGAVVVRGTASAPGRPRRPIA
jgi:excisionase family DNA binding protein